MTNPENPQDPSASVEGTEGEPIISNDEMEALLEGVENGDLGADGGLQAGEAVAIDLITQSLGKVLMPALSRTNDRYSQILRSSMYDLVQKPVEVKFESLDNVTLGAFLKKQTTPTGFGIFSLSEMSGVAMMAVEPQLLFCIVSSYFGGEGEQQRDDSKVEFSSTEIRVAQMFIRQALRDLEAAWIEMLPVKAQSTAFETNPSMALITDKTDSIIISNFSMEIEGIGGGRFCFVLPKAMMEPVHDVFMVESRANQPVESPEWQRALRQQALEIKAETRAVLTTIPTTIRDVARLRVGDVLPIEDPNSIVMNLEGVPFRHALFGESNGKAAVRLGDIVTLEQSVQERLDDALRVGSHPEPSPSE